MRLFFIALAIIFNCFGWCYAQQDDSIRYDIKHYTDENGLPQNSIRSIAPDEKGFLWLATEDGLVRFDGSNFKIYNVTNTNISSNRIVNIRRDISDGHLFAYNIKGECISILNGQAVKDNYLILNNNMLSLSVSEYGKVLKRYTYLFNIWALPRKGDYYLHTVTDNSVRIYHNDSLIKLYPVKEIMEELDYYFLIDSTLYLSKNKGSLYAFDVNGTRQVQLEGDINFDKNYIKEKSKVRFFTTSAVNVAMLYFNNVLYSINQKNGKLETKIIIKKINFDETESIVAYHNEAKNIIFLGSATRGLYIFKKKKFKVLKENSKKANNVYYAVTPLVNNKIFTPQGYVLSDSIHKKNVYNTPSNFNQYTMVTDKNGFIWGLSYGFLYKFNPHDFKLLGKWNIIGDANVLYEGLNNKLWIGTRDAGLFYLDMKSLKTIVHLPVHLSEVTYLLQETNNKLWIGENSGLYNLNLKTVKLDSIKELNNSNIRSLYLSKPGQLWITTYETGIYLYNQNNITHFPLDREHFLTAAHCIVEDKRGYFWVTTNKGLFQIAKNDLLNYASNKQKQIFYLYYSKENGFNTNEFNGGCEPCGLKLDNGNAALPSLDGLVLFNPDVFTEELPDKDIFIDRIELNDKPFNISNNIKITQNNRLNILVSTPYFGETKNVHIYYTLEKNGVAIDSIDISNNRIITLQNLTHGDYVLHIKKLNGFGVNNYLQKVVYIGVSPYWYQTIWFYIGLVLLLSLFIYLFLRWRTNYLLKKNRSLEVVINKRTNNLNVALQSLEASQNAQEKQLFIQEKLIAAISHDLKTPLKYLNFSNQKIYENLLLLDVDDDLKEMSKAAYESASEMQHYLENLMYYIKTTVQKGDIKIESLNLFYLVNEKIKIFNEAANNNNTIIINLISPKQLAYSNVQLLGIIIHNLIDNSVKATVDGEIKIAAKLKGENIIVVISDNGGGIQPLFQQWLNDSSDQSFNPKNTREFSFGLGLFIVKELASLINVGINVISDNKTKTEVELIIGGNKD